MSFEVSLSKFLSELNPFYPSKDELRDSVKLWAKENGFFISSKSDQSKVILYCIRGRKQPDSGNPTRTIKCDCPFKITGRKLSDGQWKPSLTNPLHNHPPIIPVSVSSGRRLPEDQKNEVLQLHSSLVAPRQILAHINQPLIARDTYNIIAAGKRRNLNGRSPLQSLLQSFEEENCFSSLSQDNNRELTRLFFSFPSQIEIYRKHSDIVMADCTYKTNRYKMPLLHFIGLSNVGKSFSIAFCFLKSEGQEDYVWSLQEFKNCFGVIPNIFVTDQEDALIKAGAVVFPSAYHLLCIWHLNKNLLKNCMNLFQPLDEYDYECFSKDWNTLIYLHSVDEFELNYLNFKHKYSAFPRAVSYVERNLYPLKSKFVSAWTDKYRHFGSTSTSRAEGLHSQIKRYIVSSREDFLGVCRALKLAVANQINEIKIMVEQQKIVSHFCFNDFFSNVKNKISLYALDLALKQLKLDRPLKECTGSFSQIYGIPCGHALDLKIFQREKLEVSDFAQQWRLYEVAAENSEDQEFASQIRRLQQLADAGGGNFTRALTNQLEKVANYSSINNPAVVLSGRGRPSGSSNSVRRDPSGYEYVQAAADKAEFERKLETICGKLEVYLQNHTYADICRQAQTEGVALIGFNQSMCSQMKNGKSCVKNKETVEWLYNFLNRVSN